MSAFHDRLYISTTAEDAHALAVTHDLGIELAEFCTACNMDENFAAMDHAARLAMDGVTRFTFHAPFAEMSPAAVDPLVREITARRYRQAISLAEDYGIHKVVIHSGFIPLVYFPEWFVPQSVGFWRDFLRGVSTDMTICLENVMEPGPDIMTQIAVGVDDPRFKLCLDVGHANTRVSSTPLDKWIAETAPWLGHVHIHNNDGDMDLHRPLGEGVIDYDRVLDSLLTLCPEATCTIENMSASKSVEWLFAHHYL